MLGDSFMKIAVIIFYAILLGIDIFLAAYIPQLLQDISRRERLKSPEERNALLKPIWSNITDESKPKIKKSIFYKLITFQIVIKLAIASIQVSPFQYLEQVIASLINGESEKTDQSVDEATSEGSLEVEVQASLEDTVFFYINEASRRTIRDDELAMMTDEELRYIRNGIYASHGRVFFDEDLTQFFMRYGDWYKPCIQPDDFDVRVFNEFEAYNVLRARFFELGY